jgi:hypothetical protein
MREVEVPGGKAYLRERGQDEIPGRAIKLIRASAMSAGSQLSDYPELFEDGPKGETDEQRNERLSPVLEGMKLSIEQAMAWDNMREASAVALLASWTLDRPLPKLDTIGDLPEDLYDALLDAVGGVSAAELEVNFEVTNPKAPGYDETPTPGSESSNTPSEPAADETPTERSSSDIEVTDGADSSQEP